MDQEEVATTTTTNSAVVKGKRTKRHRPSSPLPFRVTTPSAASSESAATAPTTATSCRVVNTDEEEDMANCLIMLAQGRRFPEKFTSRRFMEAAATGAGAGGYYVYECKTCFKSFPSFQALGGHRASHKKPKLAAAAAAAAAKVSSNIVLSDDDDVATTTTTAAAAAAAAKVMISNNHNSFSSSSLSLQLTNQDLYNAAARGAGVTGAAKQRVHECSICGAEFGSGQALGGHMRRHRGPPAAGGSQTALTVQEEEKRSSPSTSSAVEPSKKPSLDLDLNLPAMPDTEEVNATSEVNFAGKQPPPQKQRIVFSPPPALVDCHY